jgi:phospholipid/cholesterol/gamma-HCH transport system permease protein
MGLARAAGAGGLVGMPDASVPPAAAVRIEAEGDRCVVTVGGIWSITAASPAWPGPPPGATGIALRAADLGRWDSSLPFFLAGVRRACRTAGLPCDDAELPPRLRDLLAQLETVQAGGAPADRTDSLLTTVGLATREVAVQARAILDFVGECALSAVRLARSPRRFRWADCAAEMQQCGAMALPIVSLISFLVGVTLAYTGAIVLRQFGGDIWIADLVGLSMVREMGAVMTAVVLAGRTGAAYAATLGNMKANEEIDALATLGIPPVQFLVLPRLLALAVMMPVLALYANALGILGGLVVAYSLLAIPPTAFWVELLTIVDLSDVASGVIKAAAFGLIVGLAGCLRGLQAERSADGVGRATTSAVVTALLLLVIADALFAVLFNVLGI